MSFQPWLTLVLWEISLTSCHCSRFLFASFITQSTSDQLMSDSLVSLSAPNLCALQSAVPTPRPFHSNNWYPANPIIVGIPWLHRKNPRIPWTYKDITSWSDYCMNNCVQHPAMHVSSITIESLETSVLVHTPDGVPQISGCFVYITVPLTSFLGQCLHTLGSIPFLKLRRKPWRSMSKKHLIGSTLTSTSPASVGFFVKKERWGSAPIHRLPRSKSYHRKICLYYSTGTIRPRTTASCTNLY